MLLYPLSMISSFQIIFAYSIHLKERNLTHIFADLERKFPELPTHAIFMPINCELLGRKGSSPHLNPNKTNHFAIKNLAVLNDAATNGLWNGTSKALNGTPPYDKRCCWSTSGAALNFHIVVGGNVFVGYSSLYLFNGHYIDIFPARQSKELQLHP
jgi:hypothetical protein